VKSHLSRIMNFISWPQTECQTHSIWNVSSLALQLHNSEALLCTEVSCIFNKTEDRKGSEHHKVSTITEYRTRAEKYTPIRSTVMFQHTLQPYMTYLISNGYHLSWSKYCRGIIKIYLLFMSLRGGCAFHAYGPVITSSIKKNYKSQVGSSWISIFH
jgi:hypothetical protein